MLSLCLMLPYIHTTAAHWMYGLTSILLDSFQICRLFCSSSEFFSSFMSWKTIKYDIKFLTSAQIYFHSNSFRQRFVQEKRLKSMNNWHGTFLLKRNDWHGKWKFRFERPIRCNRNGELVQWKQFFGAAMQWFQRATFWNSNTISLVYCLCAYTSALN